ncbi:MAG: Hsp33 family molecular chaperone HslO [Zoogloeaceae bacterium]|nr:Hsp33 family molecular chaperone HslO [Gammaproteobacteria bacterium]MCP5230827.1 Hsp33 family molecular chaperone HslO [Zoogloeaceae bacterium]
MAEPKAGHGTDANDTLHRFLFERLGIRGELVRLGASWRALHAGHDYPAPVRAQLGRAVAASVLLSATIKFDGNLILQAQGDGPLGMLVAQATSRRTFRGLAHWHGAVPEGDLATMHGVGRLVMTLEPSGDGERYQGIVPLEGATLAAALETYFRQSEQLDTALWLAADAGQAAGLLLQRLPGKVEDADAWGRVEHLAATITDAELLTLPGGEIIHRLFHEEDVRLFDAEPVSFRCSCSRERVAAAIRGLGRAEAESILAEQGRIAADCEFCNRHYEFDHVDVEALFVDVSVHDASTNKH